MDDGGGLLTAADLEGYEVVEREPLVVQWRGHRLLTNPPPAFGGELVALGLLELESRPGWPTAAGSVSHAVSLAESMIATDEVARRGTGRRGAPPAIDRGHHARERGRRRRRRRVDDDLQRGGVGLAAARGPA